MDFLKEQPSNRTAIVILIILLVSGIYLRFFNLGEPSFWVDELNHVYAGMSLSEGKEPVFPSGIVNIRAIIYSKFVGWSFSLFGVNEFSARFSSAVFGVLSIILIYIVGKKFFSRRVGLIAAFFITFAHPAIGWSRTCRMYTLFQLLFLLAVFLFHKGFEYKSSSSPIFGKTRELIQRITDYLKNQGVHLPWLLLSSLVFVVSLKVHVLTGLFAASIVVYCTLCFFGNSFEDGFRKSLSSKYFICLACIAIAAIIGFTVFDLTSFVQYALGFQPDWAKYGKVQDKFYYYWLLTASDQFPLAALFLFGIVQAIFRMNKTAIFCILVFVVPLIFHSFLFSYRVSNYIFNVYPFFILIIAYCLNNFYETEFSSFYLKLPFKHVIRRRLNPRFVKFAMIGIFVAWIPLTIWFRIAIKIPINDTVGYNGVLTHYDWKGAASIVRQNGLPEDVIISTVPLTVLYYLNNVDYNINLAHIDKSLARPSSNNNNSNEVYTNIPSIESIDDLKKVISKHNRGWLIVDIYRFNKSQYISSELAEYIQTDLNRFWIDEKQTMAVYNWVN